MDISTKELELVKHTEESAQQITVRELEEVQLAMIGGGMGNELFG